MVRRNLLINNILSEPQNEVCYEENQTYRFHKGNHGPNRFHESKGTICSKKKKNSTPRRLLWCTNMAAVFGLGPIMWPVMTSCEDNLIRTMLFMDGRRRALWLGRSKQLVYSHVVSNNHQTSPTNTQLLVDSTANYYFPIELIWRIYDAS